MGLRGIAVMAALTALVAIGGDESWVVTFAGRSAPSAHRSLTPDGFDQYGFGDSSGELVALAPPTNVSGNLREAIWADGTPDAVDAQSCARWKAPNAVGSTQQGAVLRLATDPTGRTRAVTVTKNIYFSFSSVFNVHVWDTTAAQPFTLVGQIWLSEAFSVHDGVDALPWQMCARAVGTTVEMKAWTEHDPEPAWGDPAWGGSIELDPAWVYPGKAGWYVGHVPPGGEVRFDHLRTWRHRTRPTTAVRHL